MRLVAKVPKPLHDVTIMQSKNKKLPQHQAASVKALASPQGTWMHFLKFYQSLRFRLILISILVIVAGGAVRYQMGISIVRDGVQELVTDQQLSLAKYVAADVDQSLRLRQQMLEKLAIELPLPLLQQPQAMQAWLARR